MRLVGIFLVMAMLALFGLTLSARSISLMMTVDIGYMKELVKSCKNRFIG